jgi:hypothetical protein
VSALGRGQQTAITSGANLIADAATRSLIQGTNFGDNIIAGLPSVIGNTIGNMIANGVQGAGKMSAIEKAFVAEAERSANSPIVTSSAGFGDESDEIALTPAVFTESEFSGGLLKPASLNSPFGDDWLEEQLRPFTLEGIIETLASGSRMAALDALVGAPSLLAEKGFDLAGREGAALLLREFRTGEGPADRYFGLKDPFTIGFVNSDTTQYHIQRALRDWNSRKEGFYGRDGTYTGYRATFLPLKAGFSLDISNPIMVRPNVQLTGSPEAHVIGSFGLDGRIVGPNTIQWTAKNTMSLSSYFAENWHRVDVVSDNYRPQRYGNTTQTVVWRTDFSRKRK